MSFKRTIPLPEVSLPRLTSVPRNPPGWNTTEVSIRNRGDAAATKFQPVEPAGDPPPDWAGTRPEWAVYWALLMLKLSPAADFQYQANLPGVEMSYYSTLDFYLPDLRIGIEVQGTFWHIGLGSDRSYTDTLRRVSYAQQGVTVVLIDEPDALADPIYFTREALAGNDYSVQSKGV